MIIRLRDVNNVKGNAVSRIVYHFPLYLSSEEVMLGKWREIIESKLQTATVEHKIGFGDDIPSTINSMIETEKADLLIVTNNEKSFFKALFSGNLVRSIAFSPQIPILFFKSE